MKRDLVSFVASSVRATACRSSRCGEGLPKTYPRAGCLAHSPPRSARPRGLSRGVVRPGGGAVFMVAAVAGSQPWRCRSSAAPKQAGAGPRRTLNRWMDPQRIACGTMGAPLALLDFVSTSTSARSRRLRRPHRPAHPLRITLRHWPAGLWELAVPPPTPILRSAGGASRRMLQEVREPRRASFETPRFAAPQDEGWSVG